jgi:hypothetical protein
MAEWSPQEFVPQRTGRFAIIGDLQRTLRPEFRRKSNPEESAHILERIAEDQPDFAAPAVPGALEPDHS